MAVCRKTGGGVRECVSTEYFFGLAGGMTKRYDEGYDEVASCPHVFSKPRGV